jgi:hypothetical protein
MMTSRTSRAVAFLGIGMACLLTPALVPAASASSGAAAQASTQIDAAPAGPASIWGPNANGWHLHIINDTRYRLEYNAGIGNNVYYSPKEIPAGARETGIRGRASIVGGPANMDAFYTLIGSATSPDGLAVRVNPTIKATFDGRVTATCPIARIFIPFPHPVPGFHCTVITAVRNLPVTVRIYTSNR